jgi:hypothetical protein
MDGGATTVFVVQSVTSGNGRNSTTTTAVLLLSAATGSHTTSITPAGTISDIDAPLTIYSATGAVIKNAAL